MINCEGSVPCVSRAASQHRGFWFNKDNASNNSVVEGFTIKNGCIRNGTNTFGGAILIDQAQPTIRGCVFDQNKANSGGAIGLLGVDPASDYSPVIQNCTIRNNQAMSGYGGGVYVDVHNDPEIKNCLITGNSTPYWGGGLYWGLGCDTRIEECVIDNNTASSGGGVYITNVKENPDVTPGPYILRTRIGPNNSATTGEGGGIKVAGIWGPNQQVVHLWIENCAIIQNHADASSGGGVSLSGGGQGFPLNVTLANNTIAGNTAVSGGGLHDRDFTPITAANLTMMHNKALGTNGGSAIYFEGSSLSTVSNATIWYDTAPPAQPQVRTSTSNLTVQYSNIQDTLPANVTTIANISANPLYVDPDGADNNINTLLDNDYHLQDESPCNDAGSVPWVPQDDLNLDNNPSTTVHIPLDSDDRDRFVDDPPGPYLGVLDTPNGYNEYVDIGAYEYHGITCPVPATFTSLPASGTIDARHPHPYYNSGFTYRQGIGSPNTYTGGPEPIRVTLGVSGAANLVCWQFCETGIEEVKPPTPPLSANYIQSITEVQSGVYDILLNRPISGGHWTTIKYGGPGNCISFASLPADVDGSRVAAPADILALIDYLNGAGGVPYNMYGCDVDHSNLCAPADILEVIDLLNGASTFLVWNGRGLPANTCACEAGAPTCFGGGAFVGQSLGAPVGTALAPAPGSENQFFADWFVNYLTTVNPTDSASAEEFTQIVDSLTQWCVDHFTVEEQAALADRLSDPTLVFASESGRLEAATVVAALGS